MDDCVTNGHVNCSSTYGSPYSRPANIVDFFRQTFASVRSAPETGSTSPRSLQLLPIPEHPGDESWKYRMSSPPKRHLPDIRYSLSPSPHGRGDKPGAHYGSAGDLASGRISYDAAEVENTNNSTNPDEADEKSEMKNSDTSTPTPGQHTVNTPAAGTSSGTVTAETSSDTATAALYIRGQPMGGDTTSMANTASSDLGQDNTRGDDEDENTRSRTDRETDGTKVKGKRDDSRRIRPGRRSSVQFDDTVKVEVYDEDTDGAYTYVGDLSSEEAHVYDSVYNAHGSSWEPEKSNLSSHESVIACDHGHASEMYMSVDDYSQLPIFDGDSSSGFKKINQPNEKKKRELSAPSYVSPSELLKRKQKTVTDKIMKETKEYKGQLSNFETENTDNIPIHEKEHIMTDWNRSLASTSVNPDSFNVTYTYPDAAIESLEEFETVNNIPGAEGGKESGERRSQNVQDLRKNRYTGPLDRLKMPERKFSYQHQSKVFRKRSDQTDSVDQCSTLSNRKEQDANVTVPLSNRSGGAYTMVRESKSQQMEEIPANDLAHRAYESDSSGSSSASGEDNVPKRFKVSPPRQMEENTLRARIRRESRLDSLQISQCELSDVSDSDSLSSIPSQTKVNGRVQKDSHGTADIPDVGTDGRREDFIRDVRNRSKLPEAYSANNKIRERIRRQSRLDNLQPSCEITDSSDAESASSQRAKQISDADTIERANKDLHNVQAECPNGDRIMENIKSGEGRIDAEGEIEGRIMRQHRLDRLRPIQCELSDVSDTDSGYSSMSKPTIEAECRNAAVQSGGKFHRHAIPNLSFDRMTEISERRGREHRLDSLQPLPCKLSDISGSDSGSSLMSKQNKSCSIPMEQSGATDYIHSELSGDSDTCLLTGHMEMEVKKSNETNDSLDEGPDSDHEYSHKLICSWYVVDGNEEENLEVRERISRELKLDAMQTSQCELSDVSDTDSECSLMSRQNSHLNTYKLTMGHSPDAADVRGEDILSSTPSQTNVGEGEDTLSSTPYQTNVGEGEDTLSSTPYQTNVGEVEDTLSSTPSQNNVGEGEDTLSSTPSQNNVGEGEDTLSSTPSQNDVGEGEGTLSSTPSQNNVGEVNDEREKKNKDPIERIGRQHRLDSLIPSQCLLSDVSDNDSLYSTPKPEQGADRSDMRTDYIESTEDSVMRERIGRKHRLNSLLPSQCEISDVSENDSDSATSLMAKEFTKPDRIMTGTASASDQSLSSEFTKPVGTRMIVPESVVHQPDNDDIVGSSKSYEQRLLNYDVGKDDGIDIIEDEKLSARIKREHRIDSLIPSQCELSDVSETDSMASIVTKWPDQSETVTKPSEDIADKSSRKHKHSVKEKPIPRIESDSDGEGEPNAQMRYRVYREQRIDSPHTSQCDLSDLTDADCCISRMARQMLQTNTVEAARGKLHERYGHSDRRDDEEDEERRQKLRRELRLDRFQATQCVMSDVSDTDSNSSVMSKQISDTSVKMLIKQFDKRKTDTSKSDGILMGDLDVSQRLTREYRLDSLIPSTCELSDIDISDTNSTSSLMSRQIVHADKVQVDENPTKDIEETENVRKQFRRESLPCELSDFTDTDSAHSLGTKQLGKDAPTLKLRQESIPCELSHFTDSDSAHSLGTKHIGKDAPTLKLRRESIPCELSHFTDTDSAHSLGTKQVGKDAPTLKLRRESLPCELSDFTETDIAHLHGTKQLSKDAPTLKLRQESIPCKLSHSIDTDIAHSLGTKQLSKDVPTLKLRRESIPCEISDFGDTDNGHSLGTKQLNKDDIKAIEYKGIMERIRRESRLDGLQSCNYDMSDVSDVDSDHSLMANQMFKLESASRDFICELLGQRDIRESSSEFSHVENMEESEDNPSVPDLVLGEFSTHIEYMNALLTEYLVSLQKKKQEGNAASLDDCVEIEMVQEMIGALIVKLASAAEHLDSAVTIIDDTVYQTSGENIKKAQEMRQYCDWLESVLRKTAALMKEYSDENLLQEEEDDTFEESFHLSTVCEDKAGDLSHETVDPAEEKPSVQRRKSLNQSFTNIQMIRRSLDRLSMVGDSADTTSTSIDLSPAKSHTEGMRKRSISPDLSPVKSHTDQRTGLFVSPDINVNLDDWGKHISLESMKSGYLGSVETDLNLLDRDRDRAESRPSINPEHFLNSGRRDGQETPKSSLRHHTDAFDDASRVQSGQEKNIGKPIIPWLEDFYPAEGPENIAPMIGDEPVPASPSVSLHAAASWTSGSATFVSPVDYNECNSPAGILTSDIDILSTKANAGSSVFSHKMEHNLENMSVSEAETPVDAENESLSYAISDRTFVSPESGAHGHASGAADTDTAYGSMEPPSLHDIQERFGDLPNAANASTQTKDYLDYLSGRYRTKIPLKKDASCGLSASETDLTLSDREYLSTLAVCGTSSSAHRVARDFNSVEVLHMDNVRRTRESGLHISRVVGSDTGVAITREIVTNTDRTLPREVSVKTSVQYDDQESACVRLDIGPASLIIHKDIGLSEEETEEGWVLVKEHYDEMEDGSPERGQRLYGSSHNLDRRGDSSGKRKQAGRSMTPDSRYMMEKEVTESQNRKLQMEIHTLQTENKLLKEKHNRSQARISDLETELSEAQEELSTLQENLTQEVSSLSMRSKQESDRDRDGLQARVITLSKENESLKSEVSSLEKQLENSHRVTDMARLNSDKAQTLEAHKSEITSLKEELKRVKALLDQSERHLRDEEERHSGASEQVVRLTELKNALQNQSDTEGRSAASDKQLKALEKRLKLTEERLHQERADRANNLSSVEDKLLTENARLQAVEKDLNRQLHREKDKNRNFDQRVRQLREENEKLRLAMPFDDSTLLSKKDTYDIPYSSHSNQRAETMKHISDDMNYILSQIERQDGLTSKDEEQIIRTLWNKRELAYQQLREYELQFQEMQISDNNIVDGLKNLRDTYGQAETKLRSMEEQVEDAQAHAATLDATYRQQVGELVRERHDALAQLKTAQDLLEAVRMENETLRSNVSVSHSSSGARHTDSAGGEVSIQGLQTELASLESKLSQANRANRLMEGELNTIRVQLDSRNKALNDIQRELDLAYQRLQGDDEDSRKQQKIDKLMAQVNGLQIEAKMWIDKYNSSAGEKSKLEAELVSLRKSVGSQKSKQHKTEQGDSKVIQQLRDEIAEKDGRLAGVFKQLDDTDAELEKIRQELYIEQMHTAELEAEVDTLQETANQRAKMFESLSGTEREQLAQYQILKDTLDNVSQELSQKQAQIISLDVNLSSYKDKVTQLEEGLSRLQQEKCDEEKEYTEEEKSSAHELRISELEKERASLKQELMQAYSAIQASEEQYRSLQTESTQLEQEIVKEKTMILQITAEKGEVEQHLEELAEEHDSLITEKNQAEDDLLKLENKLQEILQKYETEARKQHADFNTTYSNLPPEARKMVSELDSLRLLVEGKEREIAMLQNKVNRGHIEIDFLHRKVDLVHNDSIANREDVARMISELTLKMKEAVSTREVNQYLVGERTKLQNEKTHLETDLEQERKNNDERRRQIDDVIHKIERTETHQKSTEKTSREKENKIASLESDLRHLNHKLLASETELSQMRSRQEHLNKDVDNLTTINDSLEKRLDMEKNSLSEEKNSVSKWKEECKSLSHDFETLRHDHTILCDKYDMEIQTVANLKRDLQAVEGDNSAMQEELQALRRELDTERDHLLVTKESVEKLTQDKGNIHQDYEGMCRSLTEKERQLVDLRERSQEKLAALQTEHSQEKLRLEQDRVAAITERDLAKQEMNNLNEQLKQKEIQLNTFGRTLQELESLTRQKKELESRVQNMESNSGDSKVLLEGQRKELMALNEAHAKQQERSTRMMAERDTIQADFRNHKESADREIHELKLGLKELKSQHENERHFLNDNLVQTQTQLRSVESSLASASSDRDTVQARACLQEKALEEIQAQLSDEKTGRRLAEQSVGQLRLQLEDATTQKSVSEARLMEQRSQMSKVEEQLSREQEKNRRLAGRVHEATSTTNTTQANVKVKSDQVDTLQKELSKMKQLLETQKQNLNGKMKKSILEFKQQIDAVQEDKDKLQSQNQQISLDLDTCREQLASKNRDNLKLQEDILSLEDNVRESRAKQKLSEETLKVETARQSELSSRFLAQDEELKRLRSFLAKKAEESGEADKSMWHEMNRVIQELGRQMQHHVDAARDGGRESGRGDSQQIARIRKHLSEVQGDLSTEKSLHQITRTSLQALEEDCQRLRLQLASLRRRDTPATEKKYKNRMEAINAIIARSQSQAQALLASGGYLDDTVSSPRTRGSKVGFLSPQRPASPDSSYAEDLSIASLPPLHYGSPLKKSTPK